MRYGPSRETSCCIVHKIKPDCWHSGFIGHEVPKEERTAGPVSPSAAAAAGRASQPRARSAGSCQTQSMGTRFRAGAATSAPSKHLINHLNSLADCKFCKRKFCTYSKLVNVTRPRDSKVKTAGRKPPIL